MLVRVFRSVVACGALALGGCVGVAQPVAVGQVASSATCYAGFYVCPLPAAQQVGTPCTCPGLGAPSYGVVR